MSTFEERIAKAVTDKLNDGTVEELVSDAVTKALKSSIEEQFRWNGDARKVIDEKVKEVMTPAIERVSLDDYVVKLDAVFGLTSEAGEVAGILQKVYQGHEFDKDHIKKELGDCLWMIAEACKSLGFYMEDVMQTNIDKLKARYPEGFSADRSLHRAEGDVQMEDAIRIIEGLDTSNSEENIKAKKMAVAAMKKQIPKKVIKKEYEGEEITGYLCPTCKEVLRNQWDDGFIIGNKKSYCDKCGQRLDWSDKQ